MLEVGRGIQVFASVELAMGILFATLMDPADRLRSITVFNTVRTVEAKLAMLDAVATVALAPDHLADWRELLPRIESARLFRNKLAHWQVGYAPGAKSAAEMSKMKPRLLPPVWSQDYAQVVWGKPGAGKLQGITLAVMKSNTARTVTLTTALFRFSEGVGTGASAE